MASFGTPLSSIPNTSWKNVSEPISSAGGFTGSSSNFSMDPFSAIATIGSAVIGGIGSASAARSAAKGTEEAAAAQLAAAKKGVRAGLAENYLDFGRQYYSDRYKTGQRAFGDRWNELQDAQQKAAFLANDPNQITLRGIDRSNIGNQYAQSLRASMPGFTPPSSLFG